MGKEMSETIALDNSIAVTTSKYCKQVDVGILRGYTEPVSSHDSAHNKLIMTRFPATCIHRFNASNQPMRCHDAV